MTNLDPEAAWAPPTAEEQAEAEAEEAAAQARWQRLDPHEQIKRQLEFSQAETEPEASL